MAAEIIIAEDDDLVGELTKDLLKAVGFTTLFIRDSYRVLSAVKEHKPRLVLLDIMMPGIDGLKLLQAIKSDSETTGIKVAVLSAKAFPTEKDRAEQYGADLFIKKPYEVENFTQTIIELIGQPAATSDIGSDAPGLDALSKSAIRLRIWGDVQIDSTPCLSLEFNGRLILLDAGKDLLPLGESLLREGRYSEAWLILSHFHTDHTSGLGLFPCLWTDGFPLHIAGPSEPDKGLKILVQEALQKSFAVRPKPITAKVELHELQEDTYEVLPGLRISPFYANHPSTTLGVLLELDGRRIIYCPDSELYGESVTALQDYDEKLGRLCRNADLLIHDARYAAKEYENHKNQGHSSVENTALFAAKNEVDRLWLFHADPAYSQDDLNRLEEEAKKILEAQGSTLECQLAKDGLVLEL